MTLANNNVFNPYQQCGLAIEALEDRTLDWASTKKWQLARPLHIKSNGSTLSGEAFRDCSAQYLPS